MHIIFFFAEAKTLPDQDLQQMALLEAIEILDHLCTTDSTIATKAFEYIRHIESNVNQNQPRIILALMQFHIHHSKKVY